MNLPKLVCLVWPVGQTCLTAIIVPRRVSLARKHEQKAPVPISFPFTHSFPSKYAAPGPSLPCTWEHASSHRLSSGLKLLHSISHNLNKCKSLLHHTCITYNTEKRIKYCYLSPSSGGALYMDEDLWAGGLYPVERGVGCVLRDQGTDLCLSGCLLLLYVPLTPAGSTLCSTSLGGKKFTKKIYCL